jgi:hypothetical protein
MHIALPFDRILEYGAELLVGVLGPVVAKNIRDKNVRDFIAHTADAALVLAISKSQGFMSVGELIREVVAEIMTDPASPKQLRKNEALATRAVAAAVSRAGIVPVQKVAINPDGTMVPQTQAMNQPR